MSIKSIQHHGVLIEECDQEGERKVDETVPAHPNGIPVSENRWLLIYATITYDEVKPLPWGYPPVSEVAS